MPEADLHRSSAPATSRWRLSSTAYRRLTLASLVLLVGIVISGAAVRLTGSGLGCSTWPNCEDGQLVAPNEFHALVEFGNRLVTGLVSAVVIAAVLGALRLSDKRPDLVKLALGLVAGVLAQILIGGVTVLTELHPLIVMLHFAVSMILVANAVVLHHSAQPGRASPGRRLSTAPKQSWGLLGLAGVVIVTGTVVTGSGPHGGDEEVERLGFVIRDVARIHSVTVLVLCAAAAAWAWASRIEPSSPRFRSTTVLLAAIVAQGAVGYLQYFSGVPVLLVMIHIVGSLAVWIAALRVVLESLGEPTASTPRTL